MVRQELIDWAKERIEKGFTVSQLKEALETSGYPKEDIEEVMKKVTIEETPKETKKKPKKEKPKEEPKKPKKDTPKEKKTETPKKVKEEPKEELKKEEPEEDLFEERVIQPEKKQESIKINSLFDGEEIPEEEPAIKKERLKPKPLAKPSKKPVSEESFLKKNQFNITVIIVIVLLLVSIWAIFTNLGSLLNQNQEIDDTDVANIKKNLKKADSVGTVKAETFLFKDDYVSDTDLLETTNGKDIVFCVGEVRMPAGCDEETWRISKPCEGFYLDENPGMFSSDTSQAGFRVIATKSDVTLKISKVCETYFIGFNGTIKVN